MVFKAIFNNISVVSWWTKPEYPEKTTNLPKFTVGFVKVAGRTDVGKLNASHA
jgi:hypothetical protein